MAVRRPPILAVEIRSNRESYGRFMSASRVDIPLADYGYAGVHVNSHSRINNPRRTRRECQIGLDGGRALFECQVQVLRYRSGQNDTWCRGMVGVGGRVVLEVSRG